MSTYVLCGYMTDMAEDAHELGAESKYESWNLAKRVMKLLKSA